jgi:hypothetical protein
MLKTYDEKSNPLIKVYSQKEIESNEAVRPGSNWHDVMPGVYIHDDLLDQKIYELIEHQDIDYKTGYEKVMRKLQREYASQIDETANRESQKAAIYSEQQKPGQESAARNKVIENYFYDRLNDIPGSKELSGRETIAIFNALCANDRTRTAEYTVDKMKSGEINIKDYISEV